MAQRKTNEEFQNEFKKKGNSSVEILGKYVNQKTTIPARCKKCGYTWDAWPDALLRGAGCRKCAGCQKKSTQEFIEEMRLVNPRIEVLGDYQGNKVNIKVQCKKCGHVWSAKPINLLRNYGCPVCNGGTLMSEEEFRNRLKEAHKDVIALEPYVNSNTPIRFQCLRCGNIWRAAPNGVINSGTGCPACAHNQTSFLEQIILEACRHVFGKDRVLSRDRKIIGRELDIVVCDEEGKPLFAIEPGSWTLHQKSYDKDILKIKLCQERGIDILIIYDQAKKLNLSDGDNIWKYDFTFNHANDYQLKKLLGRIADRFHFSLEDFDYEQAKKVAYNNSRRMSTHDFIKKVQEVNPSLSILSDYNGNNKPILVKCNVCGYEWTTVPECILGLKTGCPRCAKVPHKDTAYFINELAAKNSNILVLGEYNNARTKIHVRCKVCGNEWYVTPDKLLQGRGCPVCGRKRIYRSNERPVVNIDTGETFRSIDEAQKKTGACTISACCRGKNKTSGGYHWRYL